MASLPSAQKSEKKKKREVRKVVHFSGGLLALHSCVAKLPALKCLSLSEKSQTHRNSGGGGGGGNNFFANVFARFAFGSQM